jgi:predicted amidohydrolase
MEHKWEENAMSRNVLTRSLLAGVVSVLGLLLFRPFPLAADQEPLQPEPGTLVVVAGTGQSGYAGDGGPATQARLNAADGLAVDARGNLFIADWRNNRVRKVGPEGIITTYARGLNGPTFVACDTGGNLFIADELNHRVRKVSRDGTITTVAGGGKPVSGNGDGGPAVDARLFYPHGLALDREGNLFISDWGNTDAPLRPRIRRVSPDGTITTVAGTGTLGHSGDGGPATQAKISIPVGLATDAMGNLYFAEPGNFLGGAGSRVRRVSREGIITTVAGTGQDGSSGDGGPATQARLNWPVGVAVDSAGNLFITEVLGHRVRKVSPEGIISTVAGGGTALPSVEGAPAGSVALGALIGIVVDAAGNLYVADSSLLDLGKRDLVLKVVGVAAPGLIAGQRFPPPDRKWLKAAAVTMNAKPNTAANLETIFAYMAQAARSGADLVVFPEMALQGCPGWREDDGKPSAGEMAYIQQTAETIPGPSTDAVVAKAKELGLYVVFGMTEKDAAGRLYNANVFLGPDDVIGRHRKTYFVGNDARIWSRGSGFEVFDSPLGKAGLMICAEMYSDANYPGPILARRGADLLVTSSAWWTTQYANYNTFTEVNAARAGRWHVVSNQVGTIGYARCYGHSRVIDPSGRVVAETGAKEGIVMWSTDLTVDAGPSN